MRVSLPAVLLVLVVTGQGCLPYGCSRTESRVLSPADSLSRAYAESVRVDTLVPSGALRSAFDHPRTVAFGPDGTLFVTDTGTHRLVVAPPDGDERTIPLDTLRFPYLAGVVGTVPLVYSPEAHMVVAVEETGTSWRIRLPDEGPNGGDLTYVTVADDGLWIKVLGEDYPGFIARVDSSGALDRHIALPGPHWRYAGFLRSWLGRPVSLAGYLPVVDRVTPSGVDSLSLFGFDSPMLARSRQFLYGNVDAPPLLTASAAALDSTLFVMNMRPGWLRVDAYGPDGRLEAVYVEPAPVFDQDFYPTDLAVRAVEGGFELAVSVADPEPGVRRYRWTRE